MLLAPLARAEQRGRLMLFALLAPPSLIALLAAPHALLHDVVFAYPAAARAAASTRAAWGWGLAATAGTIAQLLGVPAMQLILGALLIASLRRPGRDP